MEKFKFRSVTAAVLLSTLAITVTGCSSITSGTTQKVTFTTSLDGQDFPGVQCTLNDNGKTMTFVTPTEVVLAKKSHDVRILCQKEGYSMLHAELLQHDNHLLASAGKGAVSGAGVTAVAAAPLIAIPVIGVPLWGISIGLGSLAGGATSASTDAITGGGYTLPSRIDVPMIVGDSTDKSAQELAIPAQGKNKTE